MRVGLTFLVALALTTSGGAYTDPAVHLEAVVKGFDDPVPGGLPGETFWILGAPAMHQGDVVFSANGTLGTQGIFCHCDGTLVMVANRNDPVPGLPDGVVADFGPLGPAVIHEDRILFTARVSGVDVTEFTGLYEWAPPSVIPIVDRWTTLPQGQPPEDTLFWVLDLGLDGNGATFIFGAEVNTSAIYRDVNNTFETLLTHATPYPNPPPPFFSQFGDAFSANGDVSFIGGGGGFGGVMKWVAGEISIVATNTTQVPGGEPGEVFSSLNTLANPVIGNGTVYFRADTSLDEGGLYREKEGVLEVIADTRTINPLTNTLYTSFHMEMSADGDNYAISMGSNNLTLFYGDGDDRLYAIATTGEDLEGQNVQFMHFSKHALSGNQLAFSAFRENDEAIFIATIGDPPQVIPTLHSAGRLALMLLLGMFGLLSLRRL